MQGISGKVRFTLALSLTLPLLALAVPAAAQTVSGEVFRDYDADGIRDALEPGEAGIQVDVFDATGANVGSAVTATDGSYSAALSVGAGADVRLEFTGIPAYLAPGPFGLSSGTTVIFAQSGDAGLDVGLANPGEHCPNGVDVAAACYFSGPQTGGQDVVISFPESAGSSSDVDPTLYDLPAHTLEAEDTDLGAVWGLAYRSKSDVLYAGSFIKSLADLGSTKNPTTLYEIDRGTGTASPWLTLDPARTNPHTGSVDGWQRDFGAFDDVFKEGLGDVDVSDDEDTLYTVDLGTRELVAVAINADGSPGTVTQVPIVPAVFGDLSADGCPTTDDVRPFGLGVNDGTVYVGIVCSGQSSVDEVNDLPVEGPFLSETTVPFPGDTGLLRGYVYAWDGGAGFTQALAFPLDYPRGCSFLDNLAACANSHPALWRPWTDTYPYYDNLSANPDPSRHNAVYPQPVISDVEFDRGDMLLGLADRWGHQTGPLINTPAYPQNPGGGEGLLKSPFASGDLLRACAAGGGSWGIEELVDPANSGCGTAGTSTGAGATLVLDEYYHQDNHAAAVDQHGEVPLGGLTQIAGRADVIAGVYDPVRPFSNQLDDGGIAWYDNAAGSWVKAYRLYDSDVDNPGDTFTKAAGIGDVAPLCPQPPLEIGNRVWDDVDGDGSQDPGEPGLDGVTVRLFCGGSELASTVTSDFGGNADPGSYLFNDGNVTGGLPPGAACELRIDPADAALGGRTATAANAAGNDLRDSDGVLSGGNVVATVTLGDPGENDHSFDFGFTTVQPATITVTKDADPTTLPEPGGNVTYTVTVVNDSTQVSVTIDTLTDDVAGDLNGQGTCSVPQVIAPGGSYQCAYTAAVSGNAGDVVTCTATASGADANMNPVSGSDPADVTLTDVPSSITVDKAADPTTVQEPGGDVTYTVTVTNTSTVDTVTIDTLTDDVSGDLDGQGTCSVPQLLAPGESYQCSYTVFVGGSAGDVVTCTVTASGTDDDDQPVSGSDPAEVTIIGLVELVGTKEVTGDFVAGGSVVYTLVITNVGTADQPDAPGPEVEDVLPPELILTDATADAGAITLDLMANTVLWNGSLAAGASVTIQIFADIAPDATGEVFNQATIHFDSDLDGSNDGSNLSDDPSVGGDEDPTGFEIGGEPVLEIPTLSGWGLALFVALLLLGGTAVLGRRRRTDSP